MKLNKAEAFKIVFDELTQCNMFKGIYDARNGNKHFMYGVWTVMEVIATHLSDEEYDDFEEMFAHNIEESKERAKKENEIKEVTKENTKE